MKWEYGILHTLPFCYKDIGLTSTYCSILLFRHIMRKCQCHLYFFYLNILRQPFKKKNPKHFKMYQVYFGLLAFYS